MNILANCLKNNPDLKTENEAPTFSTTLFEHLSQEENPTRRDNPRAFVYVFILPTLIIYYIKHLP